MRTLLKLLLLLPLAGCVRDVHIHLHEDVYEQQVELDEDRP